MKKIFMDKNGDISSMRIVMILSIIFFFCNWLYAVVASGSFNPSVELTGFVTVAIMGKAVQKFGER
jgi:hypothetical protein